ncbi:MAG: TonB-dependent receptor [Pseudomonadota bacterium]
MKAIVVGGLTASLFIAKFAVAQNDEEHHDLDEIVVTATPLARSVENLAQPTGVIAGDELARNQSSSIGETIADQPGVTASYFGPVASRPIIRGQYGERVRVLTNSLDSLDASALSEDHAVSLDSLLAERVEIIRGPATLLYGSGAAGGLVNIVDSRVHEQPLDTPFSGAIALGASSAIEERSGAFKVDFGSENFVVHLDAFRRDTDNVEIPGFAESALLRALEEAEGEEEGEEAFGSIENTSSETDGMAAAFTFMGDAGYLGVTVSEYNSDYGIPGHHHDEEGEEEEELVSIGLEQRRYDVAGQLNLNGAFEHLKFRVASNDYGHTEFEGAEIGTVFDTDGVDVRVELKHGNWGGFEGAIGMQYKSIDFSAIGDEAFVPSSDTKQVSLFLFEEFGLSDALVFQGSARVESQDLSADGFTDTDGNAWGLSGGLLWDVNDKISMAFNLALTERHPNSTELYSDGPHLAVQRYERGSVVLGNGELGKESSTNLDVTLRGRFDSNEFSVTAFLNRVDDYILLSPTALEIDALPVFDYGQSDVELYGFEAEWLVDVMETDNGHLHARLFSDFVYGEEKNGRYLPRIPPLRFGAGLHFSNDKFDTSIEATYFDEQDNVAEGELPTDSYTIVNAEVSYRMTEPDLLLFVRGTNLGNEDARRHSSPLKDIAPLPGRSIHLGLRWDF